MAISTPMHFVVCQSYGHIFLPIHTLKVNSIFVYLKFVSSSSVMVFILYVLVESWKFVNSIHRWVKPTLQLEPEYCVLVDYPGGFALILFATRASLR